MPCRGSLISIHFYYILRLRFVRLEENTPEGGEREGGREREREMKYILGCVSCYHSMSVSM